MCRKNPNGSRENGDFHLAFNQLTIQKHRTQCMQQIDASILTATLIL